MTPNLLAPHILFWLAVTQQEGRPAPTLATLTQALQVRRGDVRRTVTRLHQQGYLDATRLRLTLVGFAVGASFSPRKLPTLRRTPRAGRLLLVTSSAA